MDRPVATIAPGLSNTNNFIDINHNNIFINPDSFHDYNQNVIMNGNGSNNINPYNANVNPINNGSLIYNVNNNPVDGLVFDDKLIDFDQDLDTLSLSLWQTEGFNGINCDEPMKIEDINQTDISYFTGGPTLAELNLVDEKIDSTDLDEYLADSPVSTDVKDDLAIDVTKLPLTQTDPSSFNGNISSNVAVQLTSDEVDQIVSLVGSSTDNTRDFGPVGVNNLTQPSYSPRCLTWETPKPLDTLCCNELQSRNPITSSQSLKDLSQSESKPYIERKLFAPTTSSDVTSTSGSFSSPNPVPISPSMTIKQEPVSPLPNQFDINHEKGNTDTTEERVASSSSNVQTVAKTSFRLTRLRTRNISNSTECSFSSHDEGFASQPEDNSDNDQENDDSDDESFYKDYDVKDLLGATTSGDLENRWALDIGRSRKSGQQRYFWQYNVQSKGPKGTRVISLQDICNDPHVLMEAKDPVFSSECSMEGVKHAGKARRGDGNDLTPNPNKLLMIGLELKKLSKVINELIPVTQVPVNSRVKSRKEKNKLASRACRLKKKAQLEANKIKLHGLQQEHKRMMNALIDVQNLANIVIEEKNPSIREGKLVDLFEQIILDKGPKIKVAGNSTEFVNSVLDNVSSGLLDGGLDKI